MSSCRDRSAASRPRTDAPPTVGSDVVRGRSSSVAKHSSFSSGAERSNYGNSRSLRRLSSLPADFCCSICMNVFKKPSMLSCGHSFCSGCIQNWLSESVSCPTCRTGTQLPIRNIALEQVVEEFRQSRQNRSRSARSSAAWEEESSSASLSRQRSLGDSRRSRFIVEGPVVIVDGPGSSSGALCTPNCGKSANRSLSSLQRADFNVSENEIRCPGSRSSGSVEASPSGNFSRASFFRRSVCAIRKSIGRRSKKKDTNGTPEDRASVGNQPRPSTFDEKVTETGSHCEEMSSTKRFTWKKLFPFKLKKVHPFRSDKKCAVATCGPVCVYSGFGRTFERINPGEEIAIIVFGRRGVGKTSLLDNATLSCEGRHGIAPLGLTERMRLGGKLNHMEYRFAHMTSITVQTPRQLFVIDLIDAEFEDDHSIAHTSYMRAADAAIVIYSCSDSASLLTAMSIHRQLVAVSESRKPCVLLANVIQDALQRNVTREMGEKTARNIRTTYMEADLLVQDGSVPKAIEYLSRAVVTERKKADLKDTCSVM